MKGIVLAGGYGTRLFPLTQCVSKQLLPIYDKPTIYYPIATLMLAGIQEILIISTPRDLSILKAHFGSGEAFGLKLQYCEQEKPNGIAEAFILAQTFIGQDLVCLILGDNIFYGSEVTDFLKKAQVQTGATLFAYRVHDPERYGVLVWDEKGVLSHIEEKPRHRVSDWVVTGLYCYDASVVQKAKTLQVSPRGELEITDLNNLYLQEKAINVFKLSRQVAWLDTGTFESLLEASFFVKTLQDRQGFKMACLEAIALTLGWMTLDQLHAFIQKMPRCAYREALEAVSKEHKAV